MLKLFIILKLAIWFYHIFFRANLVETFISGSKTATALNGKILSSADRTYRKRLNENRKEKNVPNCDLDVYVDNIRKYIVKNYQVHNERNNSPNVITVIMNIELQEEVNNKENIQYIENLKCGCWQNNLTEPEIQKMMEKKIVEAQSILWEYHYNYLYSLSFYQLSVIWMSWYWRNYQQWKIHLVIGFVAIVTKILK